MPDPRRYPFSVGHGVSRETGSLPFLPLSLQHRAGAPIGVEGLLDTGATVSVLPYRVGLQLGAVWSPRAHPVLLTGNFKAARGQSLSFTQICAASLGQSRFEASRKMGASFAVSACAFPGGCNE